MNSFPRDSQNNPIDDWKLPDDWLHLAKMYHKIGGFFKLDFQQFMDLPRWIVRAECQILDEKEGDMKSFISYEESGMFKNLLRLFGKKEDQ